MKIAHLAVAALALIAAFATPAAAQRTGRPVGSVGQAEAVPHIATIEARIAHNLAEVEAALGEARTIYNRALQNGQPTRRMVRMIVKLEEKRTVLQFAAGRVRQLREQEQVFPPVALRAEHQMALRRLEHMARQAGLTREEFGFLRNRLAGGMLGG